MNQTAKPLTIFLFNNSRDLFSRRAHSILLKHLSDCSSQVVQVVPALENKEINIIVSEGRTIRGMNRKFRGVDASTDVLSFPLDDSVFGEVWLCPSVIESNAHRFNQSFENELLRICIHGILHLAGYDHKKAFYEHEKQPEVMFKLQEQIHSGVISSRG